jgi:NTP pyrophosphatase (non-canonical NTP hydrolase)
MITTKRQRERMDNLQELMTIMMEECGELIQQCSKSIRSDNYYDNKKLTEEVGDVMCMIDLLHEYDIISWTDIDERVLEKKEKLKKWSSLYDE